MAGIGLVLVALVSFSYARLKGYESADKYHEADHAAHAERESQYNRCIMLPSVEEVRECYKNPAETSRSEERAQQDLNAQREMANWAEGMLWASLASVFATLVGIVYVRKTLIETRRIGQAQVRAYLSCKAADYGIEDDWFQCTVVIANSGQSPALDVRLSAGIATKMSALNNATSSYELTNRLSKKATWEMGIIQAGSEEPGTLLWAGDDIDADMMDRLKDPAGTFDIVCRVTWRDVFDNWHGITFSLGHFVSKTVPVFTEKFEREGGLTPKNHTDKE